MNDHGLVRYFIEIIIKLSLIMLLHCHSKKIYVISTCVMQFLILVLYSCIYIYVTASVM